ncbi:MAG: hypothetical protein M3P18_11915 [Actinomycetota bacterium]|nr:hypothetical protein [Actinomycetota bacterium]
MDPRAKLSLRLDRAIEHLETLRDEIIGSDKPDTLSLIGDKEPETRRKVIRLHVVAEPPPRLGLLAGEISYQLRSTLNNLVASLIVANGHTVTFERTFPIVRDPGQWTPDNIEKWLGGLIGDQVAIVREYQPFLSDDPDLHPLRGLARLTNLDKHETIPPSFVLMGRARIQVFAPDDSVTVSEFEWAAPPFAKPLHEGAILCSFLTSPDPDRSVQVKWDAQLPIGFGEPVAATITDLGRMIELVRTIIARFETA